MSITVTRNKSIHNRAETLTLEQQQRSGALKDALNTLIKREDARHRAIFERTLGRVTIGESVTQPAITITRNGMPHDN